MTADGHILTPFSKPQQGNLVLWGVEGKGQLS